MKIDTDKMTYKQMITASQELKGVIALKAVVEKDVLKARMIDMAKKHGFEISELVSTSVPRKIRKKSTVLYRDPKKPEQTWAGRGRPPKWMVGNRSQYEVQA